MTTPAPRRLDFGVQTFYALYMSPYFKVAIAFLIAVVMLAIATCAQSAEPDPKCWVCKIMPPAPSGHVPPKALPPADQAPDPDVIPKDTKPGPLFDMDKCDPDAQLIYNCNRLET